MAKTVINLCKANKIILPNTTTRTFLGDDKLNQTGIQHADTIGDRTQLHGTTPAPHQLESGRQKLDTGMHSMWNR